MNEPTRNLIAQLPHAKVGVLIEKPENRLYLAQFKGTSGWLIITRSQCFLITDGRYADQAKEQAQGWTIVVHQGNPIEEIAKTVRQLELTELLFDAAYTSFDFYQRLSNALAIATAKEAPFTDSGEAFTASVTNGSSKKTVVLTPTYELVEALRQVKTESELAYVDKAFEITNRAFDYIFAELHAGMTEKEVGWLLERFMREAGADKIKENHVIASGPRSALPHGRATERILQTGDFLTMDIGAVVGGYYADMTRTVVIGKADARQQEVYNLVLEAQDMALNLMHSGRVCEQADKTIRDFFASKGVAENFAHSLGHALGLEIHEKPVLRSGDSTRLQPGHVITVEPGLYFPNWGGVRIEDPVVITQNGHRNLATVTKELLCL